jgi:hypothetical protein
MTQEKPPGWGKPVLLRGQLLLLISSIWKLHLQQKIKYTAETTYLSFPKTKLSWKTCQQPPRILSQTYSEIPYVVWTITSATVWTSISVQAVRIRTSYGFNKCCTTASISVQNSPRFLCRKSVLYGLVMVVINAGICLDFRAHLCMEIRATLFWK